MRLELHLGDIHSRKSYQQHYTPSGFQTPLLKYTKDDSIYFKSKNYSLNNACTICSNLYSSDKTPPHLIVKPNLPPYIWGQWVSSRCESRPMGVYLVRKFTFFSYDYFWIGEHSFFSDSSCTIPAFSVTAAGRFSIHENNEVLKSSFNIDLQIEKATLTLHSNRMIRNSKNYRNCGSEIWTKGIAQDISLTNGCVPLGIIVPSVQYDIIKIEMNYEGACLLFLGQPDTDNLPRTKMERPTAFDFPLVKCSEDLASEDLRGMFGYDSGGPKTKPLMKILTILTMIVVNL